MTLIHLTLLLLTIHVCLTQSINTVEPNSTKTTTDIPIPPGPIVGPSECYTCDVEIDGKLDRTSGLENCLYPDQFNTTIARREKNCHFCLETFKTVFNRLEPNNQTMQTMSFKRECVTPAMTNKAEYQNLINESETASCFQKQTGNEINSVCACRNTELDKHGPCNTQYTQGHLCYQCGYQLNSKEAEFQIRSISFVFKSKFECMNLTADHHYRDTPKNHCNGECFLYINGTHMARGCDESGTLQSHRGETILKCKENLCNNKQTEEIGVDSFSSGDFGVKFVVFIGIFTLFVFFK